LPATLLKDFDNIIADIFNINLILPNFNYVFSEAPEVSITSLFLIIIIESEPEIIKAEKDLITFNIAIL